jgi:hypothetical protein
MKLRHTALTLTLAVGVCVSVFADRPIVTVGRAAKPPVIDGRIDAVEWQDAAAVSGFVRNGTEEVAQPGTVAYVMYDDRALYVAVRCVETDPSRPRGLVRAHDDEVYADDCVQVFVAPEDLRQAGQASINFGGYQGASDNWFADIKAYYEFDVNCKGSVYEARNDNRDWDAPWRAKVSREPGAWTAEFEIPFASLGVQKAPQDALWGFNIFRNRPPDLSGWLCPGFGGYTPLPLGAALFAGEHPVARMPLVAPPVPGNNTLRLDLRNPTAKPATVDLTLTPSSGQPVVRSTDLPPGAGATVEAPFTLSGDASSRVAYEAKVRGEPTPMLTGAIALSVPPKVTASVRYFSLPAKVEGLVHLEPGSGATEAVLTLQPAAGAPITKRTALGGMRGTRLDAPVVGQVGDKLSARLQVLADGGKVLAERTCAITIPARPAWIGTKAGLPLGVLPPWTPVKVSGKTVGLLGRTLTFGDLALPATVSSAGAAMLAAPMRVVVAADGKEIAWRSRGCRVVEKSDDHVTLRSLWRSEKLDLQVVSRIEYDGFSWNEISLTPHGAVRVDRVALETPLRRDVCRYAYEGHAQAAHAISPLGMQRPVSSNLWLGDESRGIAWQTESLEWAQGKDVARQVEVSPAGVWRTSFIDTPTDLTSPYTARFALTYTPTKPVSLRKSRIFHGAYYGMDEVRPAGKLDIPAKGHIDLDGGTLECWIKPTFDTNETYDPKRDRSDYNRVLLTLPTSAGQVIIVYYNADDRNFRALLVSGPGTYKAILSAPAQLPTGQWSYLALSWGDKLRIGVNGKVAESNITGSVTGSLDGQNLDFSLASFQMSDLRVSGVQRAIDRAPSAPFATDAQTLLLRRCDNLADTQSCALVDGKFGKALTSSADESAVAQLAREGKRIVIFHENWSRYEGYPDLAQVEKLKRIADACHKQGMLFLVYFDQLMSDAAPEWKGMEYDFMATPERMWYHRDDVKQDCYVSCVDGPYGDLLLDGIAKLADQAGIDGVYMDGTTVPWDCDNPTHPDCGEYLGDGAYRAHCPIRATREFMKRLRSIFAQRRKEFFLDAHTGGAINIATQSFCDGYYDGEHLARYKPGFHLRLDVYAAAYMGRQFGFRGELLPNRMSMDEALAICLIHDSATRGEPAFVDLAWGDYEDAQTQYIPYWERSSLYGVAPAQVLGSLYLKPDRALLVLGSQTDSPVDCRVNVSNLLRKLPAGVIAKDAVTHEAVPMSGGVLSFPMAARGWRMVEIKR